MHGRIYATEAHKGRPIVCDLLGRPASVYGWAEIKLLESGSLVQSEVTKQNDLQRKGN